MDERAGREEERDRREEGGDDVPASARHERVPERPAQAAPERPPRTVPLVVAAALFMEFLDSTIVATALPAIAADFGVAPQALSLAITVYLVSLACVVPASGWIADKLGARRVLVAALCIFMLGSILCALSPSLPWLFAGRALQGAAGAAMMPIGRLIVLKTVPRHQVMQAWVWLTMPALLGPMLGPPLGGILVTFGDWRWIFWINVPIGIAGAALAIAFLPPVREARVPRFDAKGFLLCATAVACGVFALEAIGRKVLPGWTSLALAFAGVLAFIRYLEHAREHPEPIVDTSLFGMPTFRASILGGSVFRIAVGATPFLIPLQLQVGFGQSALQSGLTVFAGAVGAMMVKPAVQPLVERFGFRRMLTTNAIVAAILMAAFALVGPGTPQGLIMVLLLVTGFFRSLEFTTVAAISYADVERERLSRATTIAGMMQQISMSFGVAMGAGLLNTVHAARGPEAPIAPDIALTMVLVAALSGLSALIFARMPADAGATVLRKART
jgi:EmrB/QacA subfamily drug resistance transporter